MAVAALHRAAKAIIHQSDGGDIWLSIDWFLCADVFLCWLSTAAVILTDWLAVA